MKAAVLTRYGPPEVVRVTDVDMPNVGDDELLVKVRATTVNRTDCGYRAARPFVIRFLTASSGRSGKSSQPAVAAYTDARGEGATEPFAISVLTISHDLIVEIVAFHDPELFLLSSCPPRCHRAEHFRVPPPSQRMRTRERPGGGRWRS